MHNKAGLQLQQVRILNILDVNQIIAPKNPKSS